MGNDRRSEAVAPHRQGPVKQKGEIRLSSLKKPTGTVRCTKDLIEESLFDSRRDLFTEVDLVFFDTTLLYFEGEGGQSIGKRGHNLSVLDSCEPWFESVPNGATAPRIPHH